MGAYTHPTCYKLDRYSCISPYLTCRSGARNTNYRLHVFADCLRVVFNSNQAAAPGLPPAHLGYKVHVHMEKSKVLNSTSAAAAIPYHRYGSNVAAAIIKWQKHLHLLLIMSPHALCCAFNCSL